ncbi:MAG: NnrS family protein, partial [Burkholderiaceae bacterium]
MVGLLGSPHRLAFFAGVLMLGLSAGWWALVIIARTQGWVGPWHVAPGAAHAMLMTYGFMPMFFTGFLFTAGPKWLRVAPPAAHDLLPGVAARVGGWLVFLVGVHLHPWLAVAGAATATLALADLARRFARLLRASTTPDRLHPRLMAAAWFAGVAWLALGTFGLAGHHEVLVRASMGVALWAFIAPMFVTAVHRLLPFFGAAAWPALDARWPMWLLWTLCTAVLGRAGITAAETSGEALSRALWGLFGLFEGAVAVLLFALALRWARIQRVTIRLIAMFYTGLVWFGIAFALGAAAHVLRAVRGDAAPLGLAPLHALAMGFFG